MALSHQDILDLCERAEARAYRELLQRVRSGLTDSAPVTLLGLEGRARQAVTERGPEAHCVVWHTQANLTAIMTLPAQPLYRHRFCNDHLEYAYHVRAADILAALPCPARHAAPQTTP